MPNTFQPALAWLTERLKAFGAVTVEYVRGGEAVTVAAAVGRTLLKFEDQYGVRVEWTDRDFLIAAADLVLGGVQVEPRRGDRIRETVGGTVHTFEVLAPGTEPAWRWSDPLHTIRRIHTKEVATA